PGTVWTGHGSAALGSATGRAWRQERQETSGGGGGAETGGADAPDVGGWQQGSAVAAQFSGSGALKADGALKPMGLGECEVAVVTGTVLRQGREFDTEQAAPSSEKRRTRICTEPLTGLTESADGSRASGSGGVRA